MRKIDKTTILSKVYHQWQTDNPNAIYDSSDNKFYKDVVMNLLYCQGGLCAYTEMHLCKSHTFDKKHWKEGKYRLIIDDLEKKPEYFGSLDHFNPLLKPTQGWLWDNFFLVHKDINERVKRKQNVDNILKPDLVTYDVFKIFDYNVQTHIFFPNTEILSIDEQEVVLDMIDKLGINYEPVVDQREKILNPILTRVRKKKDTWEEVEAEIFQFFTAFEFCKKSHNHF